MSEILFSEIVNLLLQGETICRYTRPDHFEYISSPHNQSDINSYLYRVGKTVRTTSGAEAYYAVYVDLDRDSERKVSSLFNEMVNYIEPVVRFLQVVNSTISTGSAAPGDRISKAEIIDKIESAPQLESEIHKISSSGPFKTKKGDVTEQLNVILKGMEEKGYLVPASPTRTSYIISGKIELFHDLLGFINIHTPVVEEVDRADQEALAL